MSASTLTAVKSLAFRSVARSDLEISTPKEGANRRLFFALNLFESTITKKRQDFLHKNPFKITTA